MTTATRHSSQGFTLIEVMIAMAILAVGLLGLAGLQLVGVQNSQGAYLRTQASLMAYDMVDHMRANLVATRNGDYDIGFDGVANFPLCIGPFADCDTDDMADFDVALWKQVQLNNLTQGQGSIATVAVGGNTQVTVVVRWVDPYAAANAAGVVTPEALTITANL